MSRHFQFILTHFAVFGRTNSYSGVRSRVQQNRPSSIPMQKIVAFAIFSTRRQEEITLLQWDDLDHDRILVRDMKHLGDKKGNHGRRR